MGKEGAIFLVFLLKSIVSVDPLGHVGVDVCFQVLLVMAAKHLITSKTKGNRRVGLLFT